MISTGDVRRLHLGHFTAPPGHALAGQRIVLCAFLIRHPRGLVLFDTGIGEGSAEADELYRPARRHVRDALVETGATVADVTLVANCHLHFDHAGENFLFPRVPIFAQKGEYEAAHEPDYTLPAVVADFPGATFELLDGEADPLPGIRIVPTPGHVPGHQSLVVETRQGTVVLAGQAFNAATDYAAAQYAWQLDREGRDAPPYPDWVARIQEFDPRRVLFAHDLASWQKDPLGG